MPAESYEVLQGIRLILMLGFIFVLIVIFVDLMGQPGVQPRMRDPRAPKPPPANPNEECKVHYMKVVECTRRGYHEEKSDDGNPDEPT